jgi:hypothetical protein
VGDKVTVAGIEFTKHAELPTFDDIITSRDADGEPTTHEMAGGADYDVNEELMLLFTDAGTLGWSTMDVHDNIKKYCQVDRSADATGAALHGLRVMIKEGKFN